MRTAALATTSIALAAVLMGPAAAATLPVPARPHGNSTFKGVGGPSIRRGQATRAIKAHLRNLGKRALENSIVFTREEPAFVDFGVSGPALSPNGPLEVRLGRVYVRPRPAPTHGEIAVAAYYRSQERRRVDPVGDWKRAKDELSVGGGTPTDQQIRERAHQIWQARTRGNAHTDWVESEARLKAERAPDSPTRVTSFGNY
jgi:hypothetical protein